jgi:hypothetical protein
MGFPVKIRRVAHAVVLLALALASSPELPAQEADEVRVSLADLDRIITEARDLNDFLAENPRSNEIRERYFRALQNYYGSEKFPRVSFNAVLTQMREVNRSVPGFATRIWETTRLGQSFTIEAAVKTTGLELKPEAWRAFLNNWKAELTNQSGAYAGLSETEVASKLNEAFTRASQAIEEFQRRASALSRNERARAAERFFNETLPALPGLREAKAHLMLQTLNLQRNVDVLSSGDADLILAQMDELRSGRNLAVPSGVSIPENLRTMLARTEVPPQRDAEALSRRWQRR